VILSSNSAGLDALIAKAKQAQSELPRATRDAAQRIGDTVAKQLSDVAPKGKNGGPPPPGDAQGKLSNSFSAKAEQRDVGARMTLSTSQPLKLKIITGGRKVVVPTTKKALFWPGLSHPVKRSNAVKANDFVSPVMSRRNDVVKAEMQKAIQELKGILGR
jgi:hypothetical protein